MEAIYDDRSILGVKVLDLVYLIPSLLNSFLEPFPNSVPVSAPSVIPHFHSCPNVQLTESYLQFHLLTDPTYRSTPSQAVPNYRVPFFSFETIFLTPFQVFPDFQLIPTETLLFEFSNSDSLITLFIQDPLSTSLFILNPTGASGPRRRTPKSRSYLRRTRHSLDDEPYLPRVRQKFKYRPHDHYASNGDLPKALSIKQGKPRRL
jgi:hypothetical protein